MSRFCHPFAALLLLASLAALAQAEPLQLAPTEGVLLLHNGSTLQGQITRVGDHYCVALPGAEIRVRVGEVELYCRDLDEAYRLKSGVLHPGQVEQRLELVEWCLAHDLLGYAARELVQARREAPQHPRLEFVERRLQLRANPPDVVHVPEGLPTQAAAQELNTWARGLPSGALETYTNTIQPLLLNRCATGSCHGPAAENQFRLERIAGGRPLTRSITQRNLEATLQCLDRQDASASPLLTKPLAAHGDAPEALFTRHDLAQYQQLVQWVQQIAQHQPPQPANVQRTSAPLLQTINPSRLPQSARPPAADTMQTDANTRADSAPPAEEERRRSPQYGAPPAKPVAKDPFDPALFNQQFSPEAKPSASK